MIKCVVPISGGKDSQSCLELALKKFPVEEVLGLFCDTGFEHPTTYAHVEKMKTIYGVQITRVCVGHVYDKVRKYQRWPSDNVRFCTDELKIIPGKQFYSMLSRLQGEGFEVWYGMRLGESAARSKRYADIEPRTPTPAHVVMGTKYPKYLHKLGVSFVLPILDWEEEQVYEFLGDNINPLYSEGADRVGCFPCLASGDRPKEFAFAMDEVGRQRRIEVLNLGREIGKNVFTTKGGRLRNPDADPFNQLESEFNPNQEDSAPCFHCNI